MTTAGILVGTLGAICLLGGRHTLRRHRRAGSPSEGPAHLLRVLGVVLLVVAVIVIVGGLVVPRPTQEERLENAWDLPDGTIEENGLAPTLWEGLRLDDNLTSPVRTADERAAPVLRYAVVGEDDDVIPEGAVPTDASPDDLVVMTAAAPVCEPSRLVVEELPDEVRMTVVTIPGPSYSQAWQRALDEQAERDQSLRTMLVHAGATPEQIEDTIQRVHEEYDDAERRAGLPPYIDPAVPPGCDVLGLPLPWHEPGEWRLVHVPLDRPLRGRALVDTATGDEVPRVATDSDPG